MARKSGKAGAVSLASGSVAAVKEWAYEAKSTNIESTAAGDVATDRTHIRSDYTATVQMGLPITPPYDVHLDLEGTEVAFEFKVNASDANGLVEDVGLMQNVKITVPHDDEIIIDCEIVSCDGSAMPAVDESPAS